ncbi:hypothetical protein, partial [Citrobacter freundii]|uniref:hypothetical protein n=1 Tax=Citrobacter freundii TaxID=546 RepID=UPI001F36AFBF
MRSFSVFSVFSAFCAEFTNCQAVTDISPPAMRLLIIIAAYFIFEEAIQFPAKKSKPLAYAPDD